MIDLIEARHGLRSRARKTYFRRTVLNMPENHIIDETIEAEEIDQVIGSADPWHAAQALLKSRSRQTERNIDIDDQLGPLRVLPPDSPQLKRELLKILWSWKLSFDGFTTGIKTHKGRRGVGYSRGK